MRLPASLEERTQVMGKQIKKTVVPPREERLENIGKPKTPKIGGITPEKVDLPDVDDLLDKMKKATAPLEYSVWSFKVKGFDYTIGVDWGTEEVAVNPTCNINCKCPPCQSGQCHSCSVDAMRNADQATVRAAASQYRGVIYE